MRHFILKYLTFHITDAYMFLSFPFSPSYAYIPATSISFICKANAVNFIRLDFPLSIYPYSLARRTDAQRY